MGLRLTKKLRGGVDVPNVYAKVVTINHSVPSPGSGHMLVTPDLNNPGQYLETPYAGPPDKLMVVVRFWRSRQARDEEWHNPIDDAAYEVPVDLSGPLNLKAAIYTHLKTHPDFDGAVDD